MFDYVIAKYIRLSIDDGISESMSIPSQRLQLDNYIEELEIPNATIMEFVDNGHSGTTFDRPAFQEMLTLVNSGMINCIITKDFSRFSRNALECGYFIEFMCPMFGVRFISVSDYFDTAELGADTGGIDVSFKFMIHEYYSNDISKKVKTVMRDKMARGTHIVANAIYGYRKNKKGKWEPDPEPADVVRLIFQMTLDGMATSQIRDKLTAERYPTPREYIEMKRGKDIEPKCMWTARMVYHMLTNEQYAGSYVSGKQESKRVGSHSKNHVDKSQWIIYPNSHPAIVGKDDFDKVQDMLQNRKGSTTTKPVNSPLTEENLKPHRRKMLAGERIVAAPIYGYVKYDDGSLKIDEPAALVIRKIFEYASQRLSCREIIERLSELKYPNPSEYIKLNRGYKITPTNRWKVKSVREILKNIQYTGAYVSGKILVDHNTGKKYHTPQNEWIIIPDKHPAIISKDEFSEIQGITAERRYKRGNMSKRDYLLSGKVVCGCCGYALMYDDGADIPLYRCHHTYADPNAACYRMRINAPEIEDIVWRYIKKMAELVIGSIDSAKLTRISDNIKILSGYESQIEEIMKERRALYVDYVAKLVDLDTFVYRKDEMAKKIDALNNQASALRKSHLENMAFKKSVDCANDVLNPEAVPREIIENLVEKVSVYPNYEIEVDFKVAFFKAAEV